MATKIADKATAEKAALKLNEGIEAKPTGEPNAPKEKTTSERLFPDFTTDDGGIVNRPIRNRDGSADQPLPAAETPAIKPQDQILPTQAPTVPVYLDIKELTGKMVKLKVDGIEQDVPADQLLKLNQLERHSNAQLMKLAQEKAELERDRAAFLAQRIQPPADQKPVKQDPPIKKSSEVEALEARLAQMEGFIAQQQESLRPALQESGIKRVEQLAKDRLGTDDFRSYFDRVREVAVSKAQDAVSRGDLQEAKFYDSDNYYFDLYKDMKIKDLITKPAAPLTNGNSPVLTTTQGAPVIVNNSGQPVSIPTFESSSGVPSRTSPDASWQSTYNALFSRAQQSRSDADWMAFYRHKMQR